LKALPEITDILRLLPILLYALFAGVRHTTEAAAAICARGLAICLVRRTIS